MAKLLQIQSHCRYCNQPRLFQKPGTSHLLHAIVTLFLCGLWIPVWIIAVIMNGSKPYRCSQCGGPG
jgi:hypothetical protein